MLLYFRQDKRAAFISAAVKPLWMSALPKITEQTCFRMEILIIIFGSSVISKEISIYFVDRIIHHFVFYTGVVTSQQFTSSSQGNKKQKNACPAKKKCSVND